MDKKLQEADKLVPATNCDDGVTHLRPRPEVLVPPSGRDVQPAQNTVQVVLDSNGNNSLDSLSRSKVGSSGSSNISRTLGETDTYSVSSSDVKQDAPQSITDREVTKAPWVDLFRKNRQTDQGFNLQTIKKQPDEIIVEGHEMDDVVKAWGYCLVGYFAGKFPGKSALVMRDIGVADPP